jgi:hypothetical protein
MLRGCYIVSAYSHFNASAYEAKHQPNFNVMPSNARHLFNPSSFKNKMLTPFSKAFSNICRTEESEYLQKNYSLLQRLPLTGFMLKKLMTCTETNEMIYL